MNYIESSWNGFRRLDFEFENRKTILICPNSSCEGKKWLLKTEYFDAFPSFEIDLPKKLIICEAEKYPAIAHKNGIKSETIP